jgi:hypothetical protein
MAPRYSTRFALLAFALSISPSRAQDAADSSTPSMDASGLIAVTGSAARGAQRLVASVELVLPNVALAIGWVGSLSDWLVILTSTLLLVTVAGLAVRGAKGPRGTKPTFRGWLLNSAIALGSGFLLHLARPPAAASCRGLRGG